MPRRTGVGSIAVTGTFESGQCYTVNSAIGNEYFLAVMICAGIGAALLVSPEKGASRRASASDAYRAFFQLLSHGDSPIHALGVSLGSPRVTLQ